MSQPSQLRVLYRGFLTRIIDFDVLSQHGDASNAIARVASVLAAMSFMLMLGIVPRYLVTGQPRSSLVYALWNDEEFLLSATIAVSGIIAVLSWNAFLPERKDCLIIGTLPVPLRTFAVAKTAAVGTVLGVAVLAINVFTGPAFPLGIAGTLHGFPAATLGWLITSATAALFVFSAVMAIQGLASQILPWRAFLKASGLLQMAALAAVVFWFFATPPFAATILRAPARGDFFPSYWFTGLLHIFIGERTPALNHLAFIAVRNVAVAAAIAIITSVCAWRRNPGRIIEAPEIGVSRRRFLAPGMARVFFRRPFDRAIFLFTARTISRSRQHRLLLAVYGGAGIGLAVTFLNSFFSSNARSHWNHPNVPFLSIGWLFLFAAITGTRALFALPQDARANWIFRVTQVRRPRDYFASVRRTLILIAAVPVWIPAVCVYLSIWPWSGAAGAVCLLIAAGIIFADGSLREFRKMPFACSWFPKTAQSRMRIMLWALILTIFSGAVSAVELWGLSQLSRFVVLGAILVAIALHTRERNMGAWGGELEFEGAPDSDVEALNLP